MEEDEGAEEEAWLANCRFFRASSFCLSSIFLISQCSFLRLSKTFGLIAGGLV